MISDSIFASTALFLIPLHLEVLNVNDFVFKTHPELPRVDDGLVGWNKYHVPNLMSRSPMHYAETVATARKQMKRFKAAVDAVDDFSGTVVFMHGKYSYPNGWGPDKVGRVLRSWC